MKQYILPALCELNSLEEYKELLTSPKSADIVITGLIEKNSNNVRKQIQIITEVAAYIPQDLWFEYFFRCSRNANSHEEFKDAIKKAEAIANEITYRRYSVKLFKEIENLYISHNYLFADNRLLVIAANRAFTLWDDARYKLFGDFAFIYTSEDKKALENAVKNLNYYMGLKAYKKRDRRCICYLICLALIKLAILEGTKHITDSTLDRLYGECLFEYDQEILASPDYDPLLYKSPKFDLFTKMKKYNCPEIIRLFVLNNVGLDNDFEDRLNETVNAVLNDNRYVSGSTPIVCTELSFAVKPIKPRF